MSSSFTWSAEQISYCSNVHAGESVAEIQHNFSQFIQPVSQARNLSTMNTGLWISAIAAEELQDQDTLNTFKIALQKNRLQLTSINGFPFGNFHQASVKDQVYLPNWSDTDRLSYSKNLSLVLASCLPDDCTQGAISTLPLGYKKHWSKSKQQAAIQQLTGLTTFLHQLKQDTGKHILLCMEMEPDCVLETTNELINFFVEEVQPHVPFHEHLGICYDVCHQAVMFEDAYLALERIVNAGIPIGKIQLSSALQAQLTEAEEEQKDGLFALLQTFCEPKYLHQVKCLTQNGHLLRYSDLTEALGKKHNKNKSLSGEWRIHFHVPIHHEHLIHSCLKTTRADLLSVFDFLHDHPHLFPCLEVETYSWQVLPFDIRPHNETDLITGIVNELKWVENELQQRGLLKSTTSLLETHAFTNHETDLDELK